MARGDQRVPGVSTNQVTRSAARSLGSKKHYGRDVKTEKRHDELASRPTGAADHRESQGASLRGVRNARVRADAMGSEVKSLSRGAVSLDEAYGRVRHHDVWLVGCDIPEYSNATLWNHLPKRPRKLLLHRREVTALRIKPVRRASRSYRSACILMIGASPRWYRLVPRQEVVRQT